MNLSKAKKILKLDAKGLTWKLAGTPPKEFFKMQIKAEKLSAERFENLSVRMKEHAYAFAWFYVTNETIYERSGNGG